MKVLLVIIFIVVLLLFGPLLTIWSLNTLFPVLVIPYTLYTWSAIVLLGAFLRAKIR